MRSLLLTCILLLGNTLAHAGELGKDLFPIGGFAPNPAQDLKNGFTIAGPAYRKQEEVFAQCQAEKMPFIYLVGSKIDFLGKKGEPPESLNFDAIRNEIREQVAAVADSDTIYAWYLQPEELRFWIPLEMEYLRVASEAIREADPKKRPIWMYEPNHRNRGSLKKTLPYQGIAGKGAYTNFAGRKNERAWVSWSMEQQRQAIADVNPDILPVAVLEMFQEPAPEERPLIRSWVRHDSYASLLGGARAMVIFSFSKRKGFGSREAYYNAYVEVAQELNGESALGKVFLQGKEVESPE